MKDQIKLIKNIWKTGAIALVVITMVFGGLFLNLKSVFAEPTPNMTILHLADKPDGAVNWSDSVTLKPGDEVDFYAEIHNTVVGSRADDVTLKVNVPTGVFTDGTSVATVTANNANSATDTVNIRIDGGGKLEFIPNSTNVTWDVNGDGNFEFNSTFVTGNPMNGSVKIGDQDGCNNFVIQVGWAARVIEGPAASPSPTPSPTPTPVASPSPTPTTDGQSQSQTQTQNNNQTVNVTNSIPTVAGATFVPRKSPETGVSVLGLTSMVGAGPVGFALSRFGRGRAIKKEEDLEEVAMNLVTRRGKRQDA